MYRALLAAPLVLAVGFVHAATFTVTRFDDPVIDDCVTNGCSLREAAYEANVMPGNDTIELAAGDYVIDAPSGSNQVTINLIGDATIEGAGAARTTIRAGGPGTMFGVFGSSVFRGLTITGAEAVDNTIVSTSGGAIRGYLAELTLDSVVLEGNRAQEGGGIDMEGSRLTIRNSRLVGNEGTFGGGAIQLENTPTTIHASTIERNTGSGGGGIRALGSRITLQARTTINNNVAVHGGGGVVSNDLVLAEDTCEVSGNAATSGGGFSSFGPGLVVRGVPTLGGSGLLRVANNTARSGGGVSASSQTTLERVALVENAASQGGGISAFGQLAVRDSHIADNIADGAAGPGSALGGGVFISQSDSTFERVGFEGNVALERGGAIMLIGSGVKSTLRNVDIYDNSAGSGAAIHNGSGLSLFHVTIWNNFSGGQRDAVNQTSFGSTFHANSVMLGRCLGSTAAISAGGRNIRSSEWSNACAGSIGSSTALSLSRGTFGGRFPVSGTTAAGSMLVNLGSSQYCETLDVRNARRPLACDVGAFEYGVAP